jgi:hypothetical protein
MFMPEKTAFCYTLLEKYGLARSSGPTSQTPSAVSLVVVRLRFVSRMKMTVAGRECQWLAEK